MTTLSQSSFDDTHDVICKQKCRNFDLADTLSLVDDVVIV